MLRLTFFVASVIALLTLSGRAQTPVQDTCDRPLYTYQEVTRKAKTLQRDDPQMTQEALSHDVHGRVVLDAVFCYTGKITDVRVIDGLPYGMTEKAIQSARSTKFTPAEINGRPVSQKVRFEFGFNERELEEIDAKRAEGRQIDFVEILGNQRLPAKEIRELIQTREGELFSSEQVNQDLATMKATGWFQPPRVAIEESGRGGIGVIFEVSEMPLIGKVKFEGLGDIPETAILEGWEKEGIKIETGQVYDPTKIHSASLNILKTIKAGMRGQVEVGEDRDVSTIVNLTFVIKLNVQ